MTKRINTTKRVGPIEGTPKRNYNFGYLIDAEFDPELDREPEPGRADPAALGLAYRPDREVDDE